jgi:murein DD-endopeptidase MepM/ murein hydrolase activator NlpD
MGCKTSYYATTLPPQDCSETFLEITPQPIPFRGVMKDATEPASRIEDHSNKSANLPTSFASKSANLLPLQVAPVDGYISSPYGIRWGRLHKGIDIAAPNGAEVFALHDGFVVRSGVATGYGNVVVIKHALGFESLYGHLSRRNVSMGERIVRGEKIGEVGATGKATGPHVHLEIKVAGIPQNPLRSTSRMARR